MRRILLLFLLPIVTHAQTNKGSFLIGGNFMVSREKEETVASYFDPFGGSGGWVEGTIKTTTTNMGPKGGYFIVDHFCIGVNLPLSFSRSGMKDTDVIYYEQKSRSRDRDLGPFARYYVQLSERLYALTEASYGWGYGKSTFSQVTAYNGVTSTFTNKLEGHFKRYAIGVGLAFFISENIGLEFLGSFTNTSFKESETKKSALKAEVGLQVYIAKNSGSE